MFFCNAEGAYSHHGFEALPVIKKEHVIKVYYKHQKNGWRTIFLRTGTEGRLFAWQRLKNSKTEAEPTEKMKIKKMKKESVR